MEEWMDGWVDESI